LTGAPAARHEVHQRGLRAATGEVEMTKDQPPPDDDIPEALLDILKGMSESGIMEKLKLTEDIVAATGCDVDGAFEKANAAISNMKEGSLT
jgi:hypothetical protein